MVELTCCPVSLYVGLSVKEQKVASGWNSRQASERWDIKYLPLYLMGWLHRPLGWAVGKVEAPEAVGAVKDALIWEQRGACGHSINEVPGSA